MIPACATFDPIGIWPTTPGPITASLSASGRRSRWRWRCTPANGCPVSTDRTHVGCLVFAKYRPPGVVVEHDQLGAPPQRCGETGVKADADNHLKGASGQVSGGPSGVPLHDFARMSAPISPAPARKLGEAVMPRPSLAFSAVGDPSASADRCGRSDDMAADLSNGASGSTLHVGTLNYTTGPRPVQKVNSGFLSLTTRAAGVVEAAHGFRHEEVQFRDENAIECSQICGVGATDISARSLYRQYGKRNLDC
jgi:hypothetical protein